MEVHHVERWLLKLPFGKLGEQLLQRGYSFDYVSDDFLHKLTVGKQGEIKSGTATYRVLLVPHTTYLPETTLIQIENWLGMAFGWYLPINYPKSTGFLSAPGTVGRGSKARSNVTFITFGVGECRCISNARKLGIRSEQLATVGLSFIRKQASDTTQYFVTNLANRFHEGWVTLTARGKATLYDPLTNQTADLSQRSTSKNEVYLHLEPGQSCFINVVKTTSLQTVANDWQPAIRNEIGTFNYPGNFSLVMENHCLQDQNQ